MKKRWICWYSDLGYLKFQFSDEPDNIELDPRPWFHDEAVAEAEKDGRKILSLNTKDIGFREAWPEYEARRSLGKS